MLAGVRGILGDGQAEGGKVLNVEGLRIVGLGRNGDDLVVLVKVEELELAGQAFEGTSSSVDELLINSGQLQAFGLTLVGDLHGFLNGLHFLFEIFLVNFDHLLVLWKY